MTVGFGIPFVSTVNTHDDCASISWSFNDWTNSNGALTVITELISFCPTLFLTNNVYFAWFSVSSRDLINNSHKPSSVDVIICLSSPLNSLPFLSHVIVGFGRPPIILHWRLTSDPTGWVTSPNDWSISGCYNLSSNF